MSLIDQAQLFFRSIIKGHYPLISVTSTVDGQTYQVRDLPDKQQAADIMAKLRLRITALCDALEKKYPDKPQVKQMVRNFKADPARFLEATPDSEHTSSTVNKGESIHMCLRQRCRRKRDDVCGTSRVVPCMHRISGTRSRFLEQFWLVTQRGRSPSVISLYRFRRPSRELLRSIYYRRTTI